MDATTARPGRRVKVVNLGLEPEEGVAMGLQVEPVQAKKTVPVAEYVPYKWRKWLQIHRIELNAMTSPQFLAWLNRKFESTAGKLIPSRRRAARTSRGDGTRRITAEDHGANPPRIWYRPTGGRCLCGSPSSVAGGP